MCYPCTLYQKNHHFYIHWLRKHLRSFKWSKTLLKKETDSYILTFITILSRVSHNTTQTRPSNDVTMSLLAVFRTRYRAAFSIKPRNWTTWKILFTCFFLYVLHAWTLTQNTTFFYPTFFNIYIGSSENAEIQNRINVSLWSQHSMRSVRSNYHVVNLRWETEKPRSCVKKPLSNDASF